MKKSDLKTGMYVQSRAGRTYMVLNGVEHLLPDHNWNRISEILVSTDFIGWMNLHNYTEDLLYGKSKGDDEYDIVKVYAPTIPASFTMGHLDFGNENYWTCVFDRGVVAVEMTLKEIEERLGIKNLKIIGEQ